MAQIDVSDLMTDPDFVDTCSIISRVPSVSAFGVASFTETTTDTVGSVQPADSETIEKLPEGLRSANVKAFFVKGVIPALGSNIYPAILVFQGLRYQIVWVASWSNFGAGYTEGACVAEQPAP